MNMSEWAQKSTIFPTLPIFESDATSNVEFKFIFCFLRPFASCFHREREWKGLDADHILWICHAILSLMHECRRVRRWILKSSQILAQIWGILCGGFCECRVLFLFATQRIAPWSWCISKIPDPSVCSMHTNGMIAGAFWCIPDPSVIGLTRTRSPSPSCCWLAHGRTIALQMWAIPFSLSLPAVCMYPFREKSRTLCQAVIRVN